MLALLAERGVRRLDGIVLDLGLSSFQIDDPARGFSFRADGPLDMRMDHSGVTAADLVASLPEAELADTLYQLGEERLSRRIARAIVAARAQAPITTTGELAAIIRRVTPKDGSGIDPATRSFQALRIRVNDELGQIERALTQAAELLAPGGRLARRVVPFAGGPHRQAVHAGCRRPHPRPLAPRPARPDGSPCRAVPAIERPRPPAWRCRDPRQPPRPQRPPARHRTTGPRRMMKPFTCVCLLTAAGSLLNLYQGKHAAQLMDRETAGLMKQAEQIRERTGLMRTEWQMLSAPERLAQLAAQHLSLQPLAPAQFAKLSDLGSRLPAPVAAAPEPAAMDDAPAPTVPIAVPTPATPPPPIVAAVRPAPAPTSDVARLQVAAVAPPPHKTVPTVVKLAAAAPALHPAYAPDSSAVYAPILPAFASQKPAQPIHPATVQHASVGMPDAYASATPFVGSALGMAHATMAAPVPVSSATELGSSYGR